MIAINGKLPAYPQLELDRISGQTIDQHFGLTQRACFAKAALQGITANPNFFGSLFQQHPESAAQFAVQCADFLIIELNKDPS